MSEHFLYETLDILRDAKVNLDLPEIIETGLSKNIILRENVGDLGDLAMKILIKPR